MFSRWNAGVSDFGGRLDFKDGGKRRTGRLDAGRDIQVDGVTVAPIGSKEWGHASFIGGDGTAMQVGLDHVRIKVGDTDVPLRSTPLREGGAALDYHRIENSGRIAIVLYV